MGSKVDSKLFQAKVLGWSIRRVELWGGALEGRVECWGWSIGKVEHWEWTIGGGPLGGRAFSG